MSFVREMVRKSVRSALRRVGYRLVRVGAGTAPRSWNGDVAYEKINPASRYSPWKLDTDFQEIYRRVCDRSLVDVYRCWELWSLLHQVEDVPGAIIEVGVWRGASAAVMAKRAAMSGLECPVYLCDTFAGVVKAGDRDARYQGGEHADTSRQIVEDLLVHDFGFTNVVILEGAFPDETSEQIPQDQMFRLCHCDVDVYESAKGVTDFVWGRLSVGGVLVYDDYGFFETSGVTAFVNEQIGRSDRRVIYNLNGHAVVVKLGA